MNRARRGQAPMGRRLGSSNEQTSDSRLKVRRIGFWRGAGEGRRARRRDAASPYTRSNTPWSLLQVKEGRRHTGAGTAVFLSCSARSGRCSFCMVSRATSWRRRAAGWSKGDGGESWSEPVKGFPPRPCLQRPTRCHTLRLCRRWRSPQPPPPATACGHSSTRWSPRHCRVRLRMTECTGSRRQGSSLGATR